MTPRQTDLVVAALFSAVGITVPAVIVLHHLLGFAPLAQIPMRGLNAVGWVFLLLAVPVCLWNGYLSFIAPWLHKREHGNLDEYHSVSGLPIVGSLLIGAAAAFLSPSLGLGILLLLLYAIDGYGLLWVIVAMARGQK